ncbi:MAG: response regulator transcription factor [Pseudomonadota bacterium]|nr:response regulator transcription factor [Pseudomonadota bacterium]
MKILIADDHRLIVEAVADKLTELAPDVHFVHAFSVPELLQCVAMPDLSLALIDLGMPGAHGVAHVQQAHARRPSLPLVVLSGVENPAVMQAALDAGASGFIPKAYSPDVMLSAVRLVLAKGVYVPPMMLLPECTGDAFADDVFDQPCAHATVPRTWSVSGFGPLAEHPRGAAYAQLTRSLTERQMEVLRLLSEGQSNRLIGEHLGIREGTVKVHLAAIFRAFKVSNRTEAVIAARALLMA